jgi:hypothetical protein
MFGFEDSHKAQTVRSATQLMAKILAISGRVMPKGMMEIQLN